MLIVSFELLIVKILELFILVYSHTWLFASRNDAEYKIAFIEVHRVKDTISLKYLWILQRFLNYRERLGFLTSGLFGLLFWFLLIGKIIKILKFEQNLTSSSFTFLRLSLARASFWVIIAFRIVGRCAFFIAEFFSKKLLLIIIILKWNQFVYL